MQPRRPDSKKWTALPKEYLDTVQSIVKAQYKKELSAIEVISEGRVFDKEIVLRIGLLPNGRLKQHNFEVSLDVPEVKDLALAKLNAALDFLGSLLNEFIEKNGFDESEVEAELPVLWKPMSIEKNIFHFQYSTVNSKLETMADQWLKQMDASLVNETSFAEDDAYNFAEQYDAETLEKIIELKKQVGEPENVLCSEKIEKESHKSDWFH